MSGRCLGAERSAHHHLQTASILIKPWVNDAAVYKLAGEVILNAHRHLFNKIKHPKLSPSAQALGPFLLQWSHHTIY